MVDLGQAGSSFSTPQGSVSPVDQLKTLSVDYLVGPVDHLGGLLLWGQVQGDHLEPLDSGALGVGRPGLALCGPLPVGESPGGSPLEKSPLHPGQGVSGGEGCLHLVLGLVPVPGKRQKEVVQHLTLNLPDYLLGCCNLRTSWVEHPALFY